MDPVVMSWVQSLGIPTVVMSIFGWIFKREFSKRDRENEERESARQKNNVLLIRSVGAAIALGEATAHAYQLGHPNGDMEAALEYAQQVKHEQKDFLTEQAQKNIV